MAGTTGLEPATSDVTGRRTRVDDSASCVGNQPDARVIGRHRTTRNAPITHLLLTQLLTHQNAPLTGEVETGDSRRVSNSKRRRNPDAGRCSGPAPHGRGNGCTRPV